MANVKDVVKEVLPVVAEAVSSYLSKEDKKEVKEVVVSPTNESSDGDAVRSAGRYIGCKLATALDVEEINNAMDEQEYSDCDKIRESYANGVSTGFRLGLNTAAHAHNVAADALQCSGTLLGIVEEVAKNDLEFIAKALEPKEISDKND